MIKIRRDPPVDRVPRVPFGSLNPGDLFMPTHAVSSQFPTVGMAIRLPGGRPSFVWLTNGWVNPPNSSSKGDDSMTWEVIPLSGTLGVDIRR